MRGKAVAEGKAEDAADGMKEAVKVWKESSKRLIKSIKDLLGALEN